MARLVEIGVSFQYPSSAYVSTTSGGAVTQQVTVLQPPPASTPVTIVNTTTGNPATVYVDSGGVTTVSSLTTDSGGNISGQPWIAEGHYAITASPSGAFTGATIYWDAVRGDGIGNVYSLVVNTSQVADGSITRSKLDSTLATFLVPTGTILAFGGALAPTGYVLCNGGVYAQAGAMAALFGVVGTAFNSGAEGAGNFRVPDLRSRMLLGANTGIAVGSKGGQLGHYHSLNEINIGGNSISGLSFEITIPGHSHALSALGGAALSFASYSNDNTLFPHGPGSTGLEVWSKPSNVSLSYPSMRLVSTNQPDYQLVTQPETQTATALTGVTDANLDTVLTGTTSAISVPAHQTDVTNTNAADPPYQACSFIIKI